MVEVASKIITDDKLIINQASKRQEEVSVEQEEGDDIIPLDFIEQ